MTGIGPGGRSAALALCAAVVLGTLAGCSAAPASTPSPAVTATVDPAQRIGRTIDPVGTTWSGTDSAGDRSVFTLQADHRLEVTYATHTFDQQGDTWTVRDGTLGLHVYIDAKNGYLDYTSSWDAAAGTLAATGTTTLTSRTVTVTLARK
jgi:hypothetical protein